MNHVFHTYILEKLVQVPCETMFSQFFLWRFTAQSLTRITCKEFWITCSNSEVSFAKESQMILITSTTYFCLNGQIWLIFTWNIADLFSQTVSGGVSLHLRWSRTDTFKKFVLNFPNFTIPHTISNVHSSLLNWICHQIPEANHLAVIRQFMWGSSSLGSWGQQSPGLQPGLRSINWGQGIPQGAVLPPHLEKY